jgi:hypothetical protein
MTVNLYQQCCENLKSHIWNVPYCIKIQYIYLIYVCGLSVLIWPTGAKANKTFSIYFTSDMLMCEYKYGSTGNRNIFILFLIEELNANQFHTAGVIKPHYLCLPMTSTSKNQVNSCRVVATFMTCHILSICNTQLLHTIELKSLTSSQV